MSQAIHRVTHGRGRLLATLLAAGAALALVLAIYASTAEASGCTGSSKCIWFGSFFSGEEINAPCAGVTTTGSEFKSMKDNCGENMLIGWAEGGSTNWKACVAAGGGEAANPGRFNKIVPGGC